MRSIALQHDKAGAIDGPSSGFDVYKMCWLKSSSAPFIPRKINLTPPTLTPRRPAERTPL